MTNVVIGTAGHIDHGKSTLIKRLTGIEPDRWEEEKRRGITIDLGFAYFDLPSGKRAGIVDVPGHERFIRNMLAGVSGIDLVLMVIAADEGVMPQTQEHLDILTLMQVKKGIIVLTKADLVEEDMLELVEEDVRDAVQGTFLEDAPMIPVSAVSGFGIDALTAKMDELVTEVPDKRHDYPTRMPVDRVFSLTGIGTVVTGTMHEGTVSEGDVLQFYPSGKEARIRSVQNHGETVKTAYAGQRVALNVTGIDKDHIHRGDVLAKPGSMKTSMMLDVEIELLASGKREIGNWSRLHLYQGTQEILCRIVLLDREVLKPGEKCVAQLRLEETTACKYGDRFVLRFYSPLETIGGGTILDPNAIKHKRFKEDVLDQLHMKLQGDTSQIVDDMLMRMSPELPMVSDLAKQTGLTDDSVSDILNQMQEEGMAKRFTGDVWLSGGWLSILEEKMISELSGFHKKNPLKPGMPKEELRSRILSQAKGKVFDEVLATYVESSSIKSDGLTVSLFKFRVQFSPKQKEVRDKLIKAYDQAGMKPLNIGEIESQVGMGKKEKDILTNLISTGELVRINEQVYLYHTHYKVATDALHKHFEANESITLAEYRDIAGTSRKIAVALLEHFDSLKVTKRKEDVRVLVAGK